VFRLPESSSRTHFFNAIVALLPTRLAPACTPSLADITKPQLSLQGPALVSSIAAAGAGSTEVAIPKLSASDEGNVLGLGLTTTCRGMLKPSGLLTYTEGIKATFAVGTTNVNCIVTDKAGNPSTPVTFTVTVECPLGFNVSSSVCQGEACAFHAVC
jgi:hypothetical protein